MDPVLEYVYLGDDVSDGLMLWGAVGIDTSASYTISPAATLTEEGGVANANAMGGMGGSGGPPDGSGMPSGAGSGTASSGAASSTASSAEAASSSSSSATRVLPLFGFLF